MILGNAGSGDVGEIVWIFKELMSLRIGYNEFSFAGVLTVCKIRGVES